MDFTVEITQVFRFSNRKICVLDGIVINGDMRTLNVELIHADQRFPLKLTSVMSHHNLHKAGRNVSFSVDARQPGSDLIVEGDLLVPAPVQIDEKRSVFRRCRFTRRP